ncbi:ABC-2 transporter permease [Priestia megaterium]|uniref:ABC-2 transporter permease n=1 Tax=Priestia megaterium TaxID=1404 RepID=UPI0015CF694F|nr:ABC-2 transporter permease [Priestia megaterium]
MYNLIRKDFILQKYLMLFYLFIAIFYTMTDMSMGLVITVLSVFFTINSHYYDEKGKNNVLINSLPFSRKQIIASKYIGVLIFLFITTLIIWLIRFICQDIVSHSMTRGSITELLISYAIAILFVSFYFPFFYRFPNRILLSGFSILVIMMVALGKTIVSRFGNVMSDFINGIQTFASQFSTTGLYISAFVITILIFSSSWFLTLKIYENKDF